MTPIRFAATAIGGTALMAAALAVPISTSSAGAALQSTTATAPATLPTTGLDILLSNDDGWDALGIQAVKSALVDAGHHVTMSAPAANNSGVSARVQFGGNLEVIDHGDTEYSTTGSPVTSLIYGMEELFLK